MDKKTIGSFIAALRKSTGLTQRELADRLNVSDKAVSRWERDECAPDLSLIPAIAEILCVTSEEIIRGERILLAPDIAASRGDTKTEKQIERILKSTSTQFKALSVISVGISIFGFLAVWLINQIYGQMAIAFLVGSAFFIVAIIIEIALFIFSYSKIDEDEFSVKLHSPYKFLMIRDFYRIVTLNIVAIFSCFPLLFSYQIGIGDYVVLWLQYGLLTALFPFAICLVVFRMIRSRLISKGIYLIDEKFETIDKRIFRLNIVASIVIMFVIWVTMNIYMAICNFVDFESFVEPTSYTFDNEEEMKLFLGTYGKNFGDEWNRTSVTSSFDGKSYVYTFYDASQRYQLDFYYSLSALLTFILIIIELAICAIIYIRKRAKIIGSAPNK